MMMVVTLLLYVTHDGKCYTHQYTRAAELPTTTNNTTRSSSRGQSNRTKPNPPETGVVSGRSPSMMQGAARDELHATSEALTALVQHPSPNDEHPVPPHCPHSTGQHTLEASYPARPLLQVWAGVLYLYVDPFKYRRGGCRGHGGGEY